MTIQLLDQALDVAMVGLLCGSATWVVCAFGLHVATRRQRRQRTNDQLESPIHSQLAGQSPEIVQAEGYSEIEISENVIPEGVPSKNEFLENEFLENEFLETDLSEIDFSEVGFSEAGFSEVEVAEAANRDQAAARAHRELEPTESTILEPSLPLVEDPAVAPLEKEPQPAAHLQIQAQQRAPMVQLPKKVTASASAANVTSGKATPGKAPYKKVSPRKATPKKRSPQKKTAAKQSATPPCNTVQTITCEPVNWKKWRVADLRKASIAKVCGVRTRPIGSRRNLPKADLIAQYEQQLKRFTKAPPTAADKQHRIA